MEEPAKTRKQAQCIIKRIRSRKGVYDIATVAWGEHKLSIHMEDEDKKSAKIRMTKMLKVIGFEPVWAVEEE